MQAAAAGDELAFDRLVLTYSPPLWRYLVLRGQGADDAEDVVQETWVRVWQARERYDPTWAVSTWIYTIARRLATNRRQNLRFVEPPERAAPDRPLDIDGPGPTWERARQLLSPQAVEALWLRHAEDRDCSEIARILGLTTIHVRVILHRAHRRLARELPAEGSDLQSGPAALAVKETR